MTEQQRCSPHNGIWLCQNCAKRVDNDPTRYPPEELRAWKKEAENVSLRQVGKTAAADEGAGRAEAVAHFRGIFTETQRKLAPGGIDPFHVLSTSKDEHDASIEGLRSFVVREFRAEFEAAVERFRESRERLSPAITQFYKWSTTGRKDPESERNVARVCEAISELLLVADQYTRGRRTERGALNPYRPLWVALVDALWNVHHWRRHLRDTFTYRGLFFKHLREGAPSLSTDLKQHRSRAAEISLSLHQNVQAAIERLDRISGLIGNAAVCLRNSEPIGGRIAPEAEADIRKEGDEYCYGAHFHLKRAERELSSFLGVESESDKFEGVD